MQYIYIHKPAVVIAMGAQTAKVSARSTPEVNIVELIRTAAYTTDLTIIASLGIETWR